MKNGKCPAGEYYCYTNKECKPIPKGFMVDPEGMLRKENGASTTKEEWSQKYKKSIDCDNPKGFSQKAHCQGRKKKMKSIKEEGLRDWFGKSKSKDGKKGWVNVVTGDSCASDKPGEGIPKCVSSAKRASMSKKERLAAAAAKRREDPGQQKKTGASKPTNVKTDRKTRKESVELVDAYGETFATIQDIIKPEPMKETVCPRCGQNPCVCSETYDIESMTEAKDRKGKGSGTKDACYHKVKSRYSVWPSAYASGALVKCRKVGAANWGNKTKKEEFEFSPSQVMALEAAGLIQLNEKGQKCWKGYEKKGTKKMFGKTYNNCVKKEEFVAEEESDRRKDERQERGGVDGNTDYKRPAKNNTNKFGTGKTAMQKEMEKKHGKGKSAMDIVMAEIRAKHKKKEDKKENTNEERIRINQNGHTYAVMLNWRGKTYTVQIFFPELRKPTRQEVEDKIRKIYPDAKVTYFAPKEFDPADPTVMVGEQMVPPKKPGKRDLLNLTPTEKQMDDLIRLSNRSGVRRALMTGKPVYPYSEQIQPGKPGDGYLGPTLKVGKNTYGIPNPLHTPGKGVGEIMRDRVQSYQDVQDRTTEIMKQLGHEPDGYDTMLRRHPEVKKRMNMKNSHQLEGELVDENLAQMAANITDALPWNRNTKYTTQGKLRNPGENVHGKQTGRGLNTSTASMSAGGTAETNRRPNPYLQGGKVVQKNSYESEGEVIDERKMTDGEMQKEKKLRKKYDKGDMKKSMKDQYGEEEGKKIYFAKIRKIAMEGKYSSGSVTYVKGTAPVRATYGGRTESFPKETYKKKGMVKTAEEVVREGDGDPCWDTHKQVGMKKKGGKMVPNCVPKEEAVLEMASEKKIDKKIQKPVDAKKLNPADYIKNTRMMPGSGIEKKIAEDWQKKSGKNPEGGLNEKGRKSYERENPGSDLKAPTKKKGNPRRASFCARMKGMKKKLTSKKTANDPDSRINKSLRKWDC